MYYPGEIPGIDSELPEADYINLDTDLLFKFLKQHEHNLLNNYKSPIRTPEWDKKIIGLVGKEEDKEFKKDEIKPDGTKVTTDKETIKVNDVKQLLAEIKTQKQTVETKLTEL
ncbi:9883_t:CDS:2, partial [Ambispora leptoticha]